MTSPADWAAWRPGLPPVPHDPAWWEDYERRSRGVPGVEDGPATEEAARRERPEGGRR